MPRYYFNVYDAQGIPDEDGIELLDLTAAKIEGARLAGALIQESAASIEPGQEWRVEVLDHAGSVLLHMDFSITDSLAGRHGKSRHRAESTMSTGS